MVFTTGQTLHVLVGAAFVALASVHVWQRRRRTVHTLVSHLTGITRLVKHRGHGHKVGLPVGDLGLPAVFVPWHVVSALALLTYLRVHVVRRWPRLRTSSIR